MRGHKVPVGDPFCGKSAREFQEEERVGRSRGVEQEGGFRVLCPPLCSSVREKGRGHLPQSRHKQSRRVQSFTRNLILDSSPAANRSYFPAPLEKRWGKRVRGSWVDMRMGISQCPLRTADENDARLLGTEF